MSRNRKLALIIGGGIGLVLLVLWLLFVYQPPGTVAVKIVLIPEDSTLTIDGKPTAPGRIFLNTGSHELKVARTDFADVTKTVHTNDLKSNQIIYMMPRPESEAALKYLEAHPEIQELREKAGAADAVAKQEELNKKYPILNQLPHESLDFRVDYGLGADSTLSFKITLYPYALKSNTDVYNQQLRDFKEEAKQWLSQNNINLSDYKVEYDPTEASSL